MSDTPSILVLHGMSMSGSSMLRTLGPIRTGLQQQGFELIAPDGAHRFSAEELDGLLEMLRPAFDEKNQRVDESFREGYFWQDMRCYDWLRSSTDPETKEKTYHALEASLEVVAEATHGKKVVGIVGFSQGSVLAVILAALASQGDARFQSLRFGVFLSGFKPEFEQPQLVRYPIERDFPGLFVAGEQDPMFPAAQTLAAQANSFKASRQETIIVPGLGHDVPHDAETVRRVIDFVSENANDAES